MWKTAIPGSGIHTLSQLRLTNDRVIVTEDELPPLLLATMQAQFEVAEEGDLGEGGENGGK